jgi:hypothetical protein
LRSLTVDSLQLMQICLRLDTKALLRL